MKSFFEVDRRRLYVLEFAGRIALLLVSWLVYVFYFEVQYYFTQGLDVSWHHLPYRDFLWEYPPLTVVVLALIPLSGHDTTAFHLLFALIMVVLEWTSLHLLRRRYAGEFWSITVFWTLLVVPQAMLVWNRMDFLAVFPAVIGLLAIIKGRSGVAWLFAGFLAKIWPAVLVGVLVAKRQFLRAVALVLVCSFALVAWYAFSPEGFRTFVEFRRGSGFQIESIPGSVLHVSGGEHFFAYGAENLQDGSLGWMHTVMNVAMITFLVGLPFVAAIRRRFDEVMLGASLVMATIVFSRLFSTQYLVWLAPFIAMRLRGNSLIVGLYGVAVALTYGYIGSYKSLTEGNDLLGAVLVTRNAVLVVLFVLLVRAAFRNLASVPAMQPANLDRKSAIPGS